MYTGREWDSESEIYYYRARMYDPVLGRFLQRDPVGYQDSLNLYQYAGNSPTNAFDPMGGRIKWNWSGAWAAVRNNAAAAAISAAIFFVVGKYCLPAAAMSALTGSLAVKILSLATSAGLAWEAQEVLNRFCSKKLYDDPLTTEMIVNVFIGLGSIGLSLLKAAKAGKGGLTKINYLKESKVNKLIKSSEVIDDWDAFLGPNQTNINPITGKIESNRIFSADGTRSIRFGPHEMNSPERLQHYHREIWVYDAESNIYNVTPELQRYR